MKKINLQMKKILMTAGFATTLMSGMAAVPPGQPLSANPLLQPSRLLYAAPDFSKITSADYQAPAEDPRQGRSRALGAVAGFVLASRRTRF